MDKLSNPKKTIEILQKYGFNFRKRFGQNFLIDSHVINKIISGAGLTKDDMVLEIGPGIGTLTQYLAESAGKVLSVEIDKKLIPILEETLSDYDNVKVINADILSLDLREVIERERDGFSNVKVVANLPYYITTPIIMNLLENDIPAGSITVMVQKEVAKRMSASPGTKDYGALSLAVQYYSSPYLVANVPQNCFMPRPNVDSAVIRLDRYITPPVQVLDPSLMFHIIRSAFSTRRKTLVNSLTNSAELSFTKDQVIEAIEKSGLMPSVRGEVLSLRQFAMLSDLFTDMTGE